MTEARYTGDNDHFLRSTLLTGGCDFPASNRVKSPGVHETPRKVNGTRQESIYVTDLARLRDTGNSSISKLKGVRSENMFSRCAGDSTVNYTNPMESRPMETNENNTGAQFQRHGKQNSNDLHASRNAQEKYSDNPALGTFRGADEYGATPKLEKDPRQHVTPSGNTNMTSTQRFALKEIHQRLSMVDRTVDERTTAHLKSETTRIQEFKDKMINLESTLNQLMKDRIDTQKSLMVDFESKINSVHGRLEEYFVEKSSEFTNAISNISSNFDVLEKRLAIVEADTGVESIRNEINSCQSSINKLHTKVPEMFNEARNEFITKIESIEMHLKQRLEQELVRSNRKLDEIAVATEKYRDSISNNRHSFQQEAFSQIETIRAQLDDERKAREEGDELIVLSLNQYTTALDDAIQRS